MFGIYRTTLALMVVASHLGPVQHVGAYSVFAFYLLSGYLMTAVLHHNYGYSPQGLLRFIINRLLRILPLYWVAALLAVAVIAAVGESPARAYHEAMGLELSTDEIARNVAVVLTVDTRTRWVPPAWALTIELFYYGLMGLGLSRWFWTSGLWFGASLAYTGYLVMADASFSYRYFTLAAASLPFSMGSMVFHIRHRSMGAAFVNAAGAPHVAGSLVALFFANLCSASYGGSEVLRIQFYTNLLLAGAATFSLACLPRSRHWRLDSGIGDLSYPIYLLHYAAGMLLVLAGVGSNRGDWSFLAAGVLVTLLLSWMASIGLEPGIQSVRKRVRGRVVTAG